MSSKQTISKEYMLFQDTCDIHYFVKKNNHRSETCLFKLSYFYRKQPYGDETLSRAYVFEWHKRFPGGSVSVADDDLAVHPRSAITDQNSAKIRDMSGFPLTSVVRLLINTTAVKYEKNSEKKIRKKMTELGSDGTKTNTPAHTAFFVEQLLTNKNNTVMKHPPYIHLFGLHATFF
ncbi:hypothetical protein TNCV_2376121 [Trichonephila clavipes]|nr:hypothetical protein TNCV_2376121 [Trichonephila clavipes]